jgi:hypothetical protein
MNKWHWQYAGAFLLFLLNVDLVLVPLFRKAGIQGLLLFALASFLGTVGLICWFLFWSWFGKLVIQSRQVQEGINLGREIEKELRKSGLRDRIMDFLFRTFAWATKKDNKIFKLLKAGGYFLMFAAGTIPEPGTRTASVIFCATSNSKRGLFFLALGDILHMAYIVGGWEFIFQLLGLK